VTSLHSAGAIAAEIKARAETRTIAQGAETDLGAAVYMGRRRIDDEMIPCSTIIEADDTVGRGRVADECEVMQRYVWFAYVPCDPDHPNTAAHAAIRDMKRALWGKTLPTDSPNAYMRLGGKVKECEYIGRDIGPRTDGAAFVVAAIEFTVTYVERLSAP
jgi:hypothetical protein